MNLQNHSYSHCLRPVFTENIVKTLRQKVSINLVGPAGNGRERLLHDICACCLPDTTAVMVNIKSYRQNYDGMVAEMWRQLGGKNGKPQHLTELIERDNDQNKQVLILLHNFDDLLDKPDNDPKFDKIFYDCLNSMKNRPQRIALLCVTQKPHNQSVVFIDGKDYSNSWLSLNQKHLPQFSFKEIEAEVNRRKLSLTPRGISGLIDRVHRSRQPYALLEFITDKIINREGEDMDEIARLDKWTRQFQQENRGRFFSSRGAHTFKQRVKGWGMLIGVDKLSRIFNVVKLVEDFIRSFTKKD